MKAFIIGAFLLIINVLFLAPTLAQTVYAATLEISPNTGTLNKGCSYNFDVVLDTKGSPTDGTDAIFFYEQAKLTGNTNNITNGTIYPEYFGNNINDTQGRVFISGLAPFTQPYTGRGVLAKVQLTVKTDAAAGATTLRFDFDPNDPGKSTDSNVAERDKGEVLSSVVNGNYTIGTGTCASTGGSGTGTPATLPGTGTGTSGTGGTSATRSGTTSTGGTLDDSIGGKTGTAEFTYMLTIIGFVLSILGIIGFAIL